MHVPANYSGNTATPVVFMLHSSAHDADEPYNSSGWKEVGETENILTVFPSSWKYCIIDWDLQQRFVAKWNAQPCEWTFCAGQTPRDDIKFLRTVITEMQSKFNVDSKRIYLGGFSNGGQMAAKCAIGLSDKLAAIVENAASFTFDTTFTPLRKLPTAFQMGNEDFGAGVTGPPIPLSKLDTLLRTPNPNNIWYRLASTHVRSFGLNSNFTISGDTNISVVATFTSLTPEPLNSFRFMLVKGYGHIYPNGINHPMEAAKLHWAWMKQYTLP